MNWIEPKRLAPGLTIGIMAPASASDEDLHRIEEICNLRGYNVLFGESAYRKGCMAVHQRSKPESFNI